MDSASASGPSLIGQTFDSYKIVGKIGAGGMGEVYRAEDLKLGRMVALKLLPRDLHASERSRELFLQEARSASALDHPNIGTIHGIEETPDGRLFIVMAYYEGETLAAKVARGPLPPSQAVEIARQMARGLAEAHAHRIVHRDIKPANAVVTRQGLVKIVDFGLARVIESSQSTATTTTSGTAAYMSPEQAQAKTIDHRTDLWSLGVTLYEMLTGRLPFEGESVPARLYAIVHAAPPPMEGVPTGLQAGVYRALAKDPAQRYQTAAEMLADLDAFGTGGEAQATRALTSSDLAQAIANAEGAATMAPPPRAWWKPVTVGAIAALALSIAVFFLFRDRLGGVSGERHIAVLPLAPAGADPPAPAVADGLMESLTAKLSNLDVGPQSLWVVPSSEVRRRKVEDAAAARREFGANLVVNGSLLRQGASVRLVLNLIDAKNMRQIGSAEGEDRTGDYAAAQDQAVVRLARLMNLRVTREMIGGGASAKPAAYEAYLNGLGLLQRYDRAGNLDRAIAALESATSADPQFALAFASLGESYLLKFQTDQNTRWLDQAAAQCRRAADLNDQLAPIHVILGRVHNAQGHIDLALQEFDRALQLNPRNADAIAGTARAYEMQGRAKEAEETFRRAVVLRPDYWDGYNSLGLFYLRARRPADAIAQFQKVVALTPDNANGYLNLGAAWSADHKYAEAVQALENSIRIGPSYGAYTNLGNIYYRQKQWGDSARNYEQALKLNDQDWRPWLNLASAYEHLSRKDDENRARRRAVSLLEKSAAARPQDALLQSALGAEYAKVGDRDKAAAKIEAAVALAPKDADILHRCGDAYERIGNRAKAIEYVSRALANGYSREDVMQDPDMKGIISDPRFKLPRTTERK